MTEYRAPLDRRAAAAAAGLFALALTLRLPRLGQGLWYDEIIAAKLFFSAPWSTVFGNMMLANNHPLYSALAKVCLLLLGPEEWKLRLPALLFGALTPPALYLFGRRWFSPGAGFIAGLFMAAGMWPVWWSQDARGYSLMVLLALIATDLFLRLRERPSAALAAAYAAVAALMLYAHMYAGAVAGANAVAAAILLARRRDRASATVLAGAAAGLLLALLLYLPLLSDFYTFTTVQGPVRSGREMTPGFILDTLLTLPAGRPGEPVPWLSIIALLPAAAGLAIALRRRSAATLLILGGMMLSALVPAALKVFVFHRFFAFWVLWIYLFAGVSLEAAWSSRRLRPLAALGCALIIALSAYHLSVYYRLGKQGLRPAAEWLRDNAPQYPRRVLGLGREVFDYYDPGAITEKETLAPADVSRQFVVTTHPWSLTDNERQVLAAECEPVKAFPSAGYRDYDVAVFRCGR